MVQCRLSLINNDKTGRTGIPIRTIVAVFIAARLRLLSDRAVVSQVKENRYIQFFCNVQKQEYTLSVLKTHSSPYGVRKTKKGLTASYRC